MTRLRTPLIIAGWLVWILGNVYLANNSSGIGLLLSFIGLALSMAGFAIWAELKGRSPAWMALAILSPIGILPLLFMKNKKQLKLQDHNK